jgi:hypothetical protein
MARCAKLRQTLRGAAVPLLLSLMVHGLLLLALWCFPVQQRGPTLSIESTRISLDTCLLDLGVSAKLSEHKAPADHASTDLNPQLLDTPVAPMETSPSQGPMVLSIPAPRRPAARASSSPGGGSLTEATGSLFPLPPAAASVVYVLDRSVSMGMDHKLDLACRELLAGLRRLPPSTRFQVIAYNTYAEPLVIIGRTDLLPAEPAIIEQVALALDKLTATGDTDHVKALRRGLMLHPDVLYFVTDADDLTPEQVAFLTRCNQGSSVHAIEFSRRRNARPDSPLAQLAHGNGGSYRCVWAGE